MSLYPSRSKLRSLLLVLFLPLFAGDLAAQDGGGAIALPLPLPEPFPLPVPLPLPQNRGTLIDFDNLVEGTVVSHQYQSDGVIFDGGPRIRSSASVQATTEPNVLESPAVQDLPSHAGPLVIRFTTGIRLVTIFYGNRYGGGAPERCILRAYDAAGTEIQRTSGAVPSARQDVTQRLSVETETSVIRRVEVHYALEQSLDGIPIDIDRRGVETIDNLYFEGEEPPPPPSDDAPVVRITSPSNGQNFFGSDGITFGGNITEDHGIGSLRVRMEYLDDSAATGDWPIDWAGRAPNFTFPSFSVTQLTLKPGRNRITFTAIDSAGQSHSDSVTVSYGPAPVVTITEPADRTTRDNLEVVVRGTVHKELGTLSRGDVSLQVKLGSEVVHNARRPDTLTGSGPNFDFTFRVPLFDPGPRSWNTIEVTATDEGSASGTASVLVLVERPDNVRADMVALQAIEGGRLVAGRGTLVRIHPGVISGNHGGIGAELHAFRDGTELPDSPLQPSRGETLDLAPGASWAEIRGDAARTWNFVLPTAWTRAGDLELVGVIDPDGALEECESCESNNTADLTVRFETSEPLTVRPVRMRAFGADGVVREVTALQAIAAMRDIRRLLPYSTLTVLPPLQMNNRPRDALDGLGGFLDDLYDRFTCFDSNGGDVFGWLGDRLVDCSWSTYFVGLLPTVPNADGGGIFPGGLASVESPGGVGDLRPSTAVHELAHALSRSHAGNGHGESDGGGYDSRYPHPHGTINNYGFDIENWHAVRPEWSGSAAVPTDMIDAGMGCDSADSGCPTHDYLAYGADPFWTSAYTWNAIFNHGFTGSTGGLFLAGDASRAAAPEEGDGGGAVVETAEVVHIRGRIEDGAIVTRAFYTLATPAGFTVLPTGGELQATAIDARGRTLAERSIEPLAVADSETQYFSFLLPFPEETALIRLSYQGGVQEERPVSLTAPEVTILSPLEASSVGAGETLEVRWSGTDADHDALTYGVQLSTDEGETWTTLGMNLTEARLEASASVLVGSKKAQIRILATDGVLGTRATSGTFTIDDQPPYAVVLWPEDGTELPAEERIVFQASAYDPEGTVLKGKAIEWFSNVQGKLGKGRTVDVEGLERGRHELRIEATDGAGNVGTSTVEVFVGVAKPESVGQVFLRGDVSSDGDVSLSDAVQLFNYLFLGGSPPACLDSADANDDGSVELTDGVQVLNYLFLGGSAPAEPFPQPGVDPSADTLDCPAEDK